MHRRRLVVGADRAAAPARRRKEAGGAALHVLADDLLRRCIAGVQLRRRVLPVERLRQHGAVAGNHRDAELAGARFYQQIAHAWLWRWLKDELTPYPGRLTLVARMVISATLIMVIAMTFRIPYGWQGVIYALLVSRENPRATVNSAATISCVLASMPRCSFRQRRRDLTPCC